MAATSPRPAGGRGHLPEARYLRCTRGLAILVFSASIVTSESAACGAAAGGFAVTIGASSRADEWGRLVPAAVSKRRVVAAAPPAHITSSLNRLRAMTASTLGKAGRKRTLTFVSVTSSKQPGGDERDTETASSSDLESSGPQPSVFDATQTLVEFDRRQVEFAKTEKVGMGGGTSASLYVESLPPEDRAAMREAVEVVCRQAARERDEDSANGRVMMGICAESSTEALAGLKSWVTALDLPRGILHGMDVDGVPIDPSTLGSVYIKYNTGGALTFAEMRRSGMGFDALWKPGDALLETYDGDFRGVYLNVELLDGVFRQFGVLPLDLFDDDGDGVIDDRAPKDGGGR